MDEALFEGPVVAAALRAKRIDSLHHANSVRTSCTFLERGGLASRGYVEAAGLAQTPQYTDAVDKRYGIWNDVFLDTVDIHERAGKRNRYGPSMFVQPVGLLEALPAHTRVLVSKKNPSKWTDGDQPRDRFFTSGEELSAGIEKGTFDQIIMVRNPDGILPFPTGPITISLDDPTRALPSGEDAFAYASGRLMAAAGGRRLTIDRHDCRADCRCVDEYAKLNLAASFT